MIKMNETLLYIIATVQDYKRYLVGKNHLDKLINKDQLDWFLETEKFFNSLDKELFDNAGIKQNRFTLENILLYKITEEVNNTAFEDLGKFYL